MMNQLRRALPLIIALSTLSANAQYLKNHKASLSMGATGQFDTMIQQSPQTVNAAAPLPVAGTYAVTVANQQQYTKTRVGFLTSLQFHPVAWAGVELNYGFSHYQERYTFNYTNTATPGTLQQSRITTDAHETTAAYIIHPRHMPFQPFVGIGGGAINFEPWTASNQWRGAGLLEVGFDIPVPNNHIGFRVEGRGLAYRSPNFGQSALSTRSWRVTSEPVLSAFYRF